MSAISPPDSRGTSHTNQAPAHLVCCPLGVPKAGFFPTCKLSSMPSPQRACLITYPKRNYYMSPLLSTTSFRFLHDISIIGSQHIYSFITFLSSSISYHYWNTSSKTRETLPLLLFYSPPAHSIGERGIRTLNNRR